MTCVKCQEDVKKEAWMQQAIVSYKKKQDKSEKVSIQAIAKKFKVPQSMLQDRLDGRLAHNQAHEQLMHLTKVEETELVQWITTLTQCGYAS